MYVEVYTTHDLSKELSNIIDDSLQQNSWDFDVRIHILERDIRDFAISKDEIETGKLYYLPGGVFVGALPGQNPLNFSWEIKFRKWQKEAQKHPLRKAIGGQKGSKVIDSTVGFGNDTCVLLALGMAVEGYERNPLVFTALHLAQIKERFMLSQLKLSYGSLEENKENLPIYFDPMFDDGKKRKAKPVKEMEVFHSLVGGDSDAVKEAQRLKGMTSRLVIKRSPRDEPLLSKINSQWKSKALRLDLYL